MKANHVGCTSESVQDGLGSPSYISKFLAGVIKGGWGGTRTTPEYPEKPAISSQSGAESGALDVQNAEIDPRLVAIIDAWPALPEALKAGILAMVRTATAEG